ncbi:hypothetical protein [Actinomadura sp. KC345]|nr:hypothetical protein [Actinomadura sp. KC345]
MLASLLLHRRSPASPGLHRQGAGTAMVYPALLAVIGDVAHPVWRGLRRA